MKRLDTFFKSKTGLILFAIFSLLLLNSLLAISRQRPKGATAGATTSLPPALRPVTREEAAQRVRLLYWKPLSPYEKVKTDEFKARLPYGSPDLEIVFFEETNQFLILLKSNSTRAQTELMSTLNKYNMLDVYLKSPVMFSVGMGDSIRMVEDIARGELEMRVKDILTTSNVRGIAVNAQESPDDFSFEDPDIPAQSDTKALGDFVHKMLMGIPDTTPAPDVKVGTPGGSSGGGNNPPGSPNTGAATVNECPTNLPKVYVPGTQLHYLESRANCITPTIIVIHWSGGWGTAEGTANTLNQRGLRCHLGTDADKQLQYLDFYGTQVERGSCTWGAGDFTVDNEISGVYFDEVFNTPGNENYTDLQAKTNRALASTCWTMKQYNIPADQIFGHFEMPGNDEKSDPGEAYINYFRGLVKQQCK